MDRHQSPMFGMEYECSCVVLDETLDDFGPRSKPTSLARVEKRVQNFTKGSLS